MSKKKNAYNVHVRGWVEFLWAVCLFVWWGTISSQVLCPVGPKFSGDVGEPHGSAQFNFELDGMMLKFFDFLQFLAFKQRNAQKS